MEIKFSRHATRRMKLYHVPESIVLDILEMEALSSAKHEIVKEVAGFELPLKIVVVVEDDEDDIVTVLTTYPLKKGKSK